MHSWGFHTLFFEAHVLSVTCFTKEIGNLNLPYYVKQEKLEGLSTVECAKKCLEAEKQLNWTCYSFDFRPISTVASIPTPQCILINARKYDAGTVFIWHSVFTHYEYNCSEL